MTIDLWILAFSALTVVATIWMGFWSAKKSKTASDFFVAGRSVSVGWNASAISGEYLSAASFMGVAGMVMSSGYDALWYPVCYACGYLFLLLFIAGPLRRFGAYTIPDFAEGRFDSPLFRKIAVVFVLFIGFFYTMPQMKGAGTTLAYIFPGLPYWAGVVLVGAVITLNVALGGMKGITLVQAFQYWAKMFAISVPIFVLMAVYGHYGNQIEKNDSGSGLGLLPGVEYRTIHTPQTNQVPVAAWKHRILSLLPESYARKMTQADAKRWGLGQTTGTIFSSPIIQLHSLLSTYGSATSKSVFLAGISAQDAVERRLAYTTNHVYGSEMLNIIVEVLRTNGVVLVSEDRSHVWFAATNVLMPLSRTNLPAKAPTDAVWLNPFGPLTTKAAKAAKPKSIRFDGELIATNASLLNGRLMSFPEPQFLARNRGPRKDEAITPANYPAPDFVQLYAEVFLLGETAGGPDFSVRHAKALESASMVWTNGARQLRPQLAMAMEAALTGAGITVVREPNNIFKAFLTRDAIITPIDPRPYSLLYTYSLIIALVCGTAGLPHILVRFYTNPDGVAAKRTTMWVMILIGVFYLFPPVFGVMGRNLMPDLYNGLAGVKGTDGIVLKLPKLLNERFGVLGSVLSGVTCAGAFAAFMSTFSGLLVSMTGALAHDVYGRILRPRATAGERLKMFKVCAVIVGVGAMLLGFLVESFEINKMVGWAFAIAATSYFPLLFLSTWWRRITMKGAATGMLVGGTLSLVAIASTMFADQAAWAEGLKIWYAAHPLARILAEQPAIWGLPLALGLMFVVSKFTAKDVPQDIRMKMLVLHAPEKLGLKQEYIQEHQAGH